jgi:tetrapyrrole methylase family protein/MazG family protein
VIDVVGLGPGDLERTAPEAQRLLKDPGRTVILRTLDHPAAAQLAAEREVRSCDDLYRSNEVFGDVYQAIGERVLAAAGEGPVVYGVPGSPTVGEFAVGRIRAAAEAAGVAVAVHPAESFVDAALGVVDVDPLRDGFRLLNGHELPDPLVFDVPTLIGHVDLPELLADLSVRLDRVLPEDAAVCVLSGLGSADQSVEWSRPTAMKPELAGVRTSVFVPPHPGGLIGAVHTMRILREQCPWDRAQTHQSLVRYLIEESHELADAIAGLPLDGQVDWAAYADVEEELGDVLLQVLFHATIAAQTGAFDVDDVAEQLRRKLVRRHPHVFGEVDAPDADAVRANWDEIKATEKAGRPGPASALEGVPASLPGLERAAEVQRKAAKVGFDWPEATPVLRKLREEVGELLEALDHPAAAAHELGDVLFSVVNVARHLDVEPEVAIRAAIHRFEDRFRAIEAMGPIEGLTLQEMDERWERVKRRP